MPIPSVLHRVQGSRRADERAIVRIDSPPSVLDLHELADDEGLHEHRPFLLIPPRGFRSADHSPTSHAHRLTRALRTLRTSQVQLMASRVTLADAEHLIRGSLKAIQTSRRCIFESDRLIARAQYPPPIGD